jgi:adenylosuccinate lyase
MTAELTALSAISPVDGRYRSKTKELALYFSEAALIRYRVQVEIEYFIALVELPLPQLSQFDTRKIPALRRIVADFSASEAQKIKDIEKVINHDVKSVEYYLKDRFDEQGLSQFKEFIHIGLTSQDINNTALPLSLKHAWQDVMQPALGCVLESLRQKAQLWQKVPMLARTHGQPASPTKVGKEFAVFIERLEQQLVLLQAVPFSAKFGGATGNFNAHQAAFPDIDWPAFADRLVNQTLGLKRSRITTQIEHYDHLAAFFDNLKRIDTILIDLARDVWTYISTDYFKQKIESGEVGSSTMPHKVNPIDFENAEGNLGVAIALFEHLAAKLPISRMQRDLTDSTVTRNIGLPLAHTLIALKSLLKGLDKLMLNEPAIDRDLENNWAVVTEGLQTILRREGYPEPYEALKALTRTHAAIDRAAVVDFINQLDVDETIKEELRRITPQNYTGI